MFETWYTVRFKDTLKLSKSYLKEVRVKEKKKEKEKKLEKERDDNVRYWT